MLQRTVERIKETLVAQGRLIRLLGGLPVVFVGDTHGDREATESVLSRFPPPNHQVVFLGDAVDRGPDSRGNLELILVTKQAHPDHVYLLQGNHEARLVSRFLPADFWDSLSSDESRVLGEVLAELPYAAWHPARLLAVHGALPDVSSLDDLAAIEPGTPDWRALTGGDWTETDGTAGFSAPSRPRFTGDDFERRTKQLGAQVIVRSHQPQAPRWLFNDRCLTLFTSSAYGQGARHVALLRENREIRTARDLEILAV